MDLRPKIVVVGAGSLSHGKRLIDDLLTTQTFLEGDLFLVGNNLKRLEVIGAYAERATEALRPGITVARTDRLIPALEGADIVVAMFDAGGYTAFKRDYERTKLRGLDICVGDTAGPLGAFRALRNAPVMLDVLSGMRRLCPQALLVNYVNPMAPMVSIAASEGIPCVGICGGVEATRSYVAGILGLPREALKTTFAGLNHLCWLLEMEGPDGDLYPLFRDRMRDPQTRGDEAVRFEVLQQFGYFVSESSGHLSDFFPYFRRTDGLRGRYCSGQGYSGASGAYLKLAGFLHRRIGDADYLAGQAPARERSLDYGAAIVDAWLGGPECAVYGNVMNRVNNGEPRGLVLSALPEGACVEAPIAIKRRRVVAAPGPALPLALAGLCAPIAYHHMAVAQAFLAQDPELLFAAIAQDPLTAAVLDLPSIRELTSELLADNAEWLPPGLQRPLRPTADAGKRASVPRRKTAGSELELIRNFERRKREQEKERERNPG